jgi:pyruvate-formate lyase-activating enzyme
MTNIYNITRYTHDNSIYILFQGCNFQCKGCYIKDTKVDYHLPDEVQRHLQTVKDFRRLSLSEFETIVKKLNVKRAILGGEEPTLDEELPDVIAVLNRLGIKTLLTTNGHFLNGELIKELEIAGLSGTRMSIRAYNDAVHRVYTGQTNKSVLDNFMRLSKSRIKLIAESILIPELIGQGEIEKIAKFIANINPAIPYRIDGFIPFINAPWRSPSPEEVIRAAQIALRHLWFVSYLHCGIGSNERKVINIYPTTKDDNLVLDHDVGDI